jgi:integrase
MPSYQIRRNSDGSRSIVAQVRITPFKPTSKAFSTRAEAKAWAESTERELRRNRDQGATEERLTAMTVANLIAHYLADQETQAQRAYRDREALLTWWVNQYGAKKVLRFGVLDLRAAREKLRPGRAAATTNHYLRAMRACWNWGIASGYVPRDLHWPTRLLLREPAGRTRYLSDSELAKVLEIAKAHSPDMTAAILVSLATGVRQGELLRLTWGNVDFEHHQITVLLTKNGDARSVHLPSVAEAALQSLRPTGWKPADKVFHYGQGALIYRWKEIRAAAELEDFRWHDLRHSCASFLAQQGATLLQIGAILGHRSPSVTARYAHMVQGAAIPAHAGLDGKLRQ